MHACRAGKLRNCLMSQHCTASIGSCQSLSPAGACLYVLWYVLMPAEHSISHVCGAAAGCGRGCAGCAACQGGQDGQLAQPHDHSRVWQIDWRTVERKQALPMYLLQLVCLQRQQCMSNQQILVRALPTHCRMAGYNSGRTQ